MTEEETNLPWAQTDGAAYLWAMATGFGFLLILAGSLWLAPAGSDEPGLLFGVRALVLFLGLISLVWFDVRQFRLPNTLTLALAVAGLLFSAFWGKPEFASALCAGFIGYGLIWGLNWLFRRIWQRDGVGMGDAKLLAVGGIWLGLLSLAPLLMLASGIGILQLLFSRIILASTSEEAVQNAPVPFGFALAIAIWVLFSFRDLLMHILY